MQGMNEMLLNEATMREALQFWLDAQFAGPAPQVRTVSVTGTTPTLFKIRIAEPLQEADNG